MSKDQRDTLRMVFGFCLLLILAALATAIALGHVEEKTSYGLMPLLTTLSTLAGAFAQWAFSSKDEPKEQALSMRVRSKVRPATDHRNKHRKQPQTHKDNHHYADNPRGRFGLEKA